MLNAAAFLSTLPILFEWVFATNNFAYKEPLMNTDAINNAIAPLQDTVNLYSLQCIRRRPPFHRHFSSRERRL